MAIKTSYKPRILIADDQPDVLTALRLLLKSEGFDSLTVRTPEEVLSRLAAEPFDVVLLDMNYRRDTTSGQEGLELVAKIKQTAPRVSVIVMTAWATIDLAVEAVQRGASDFLQKPWDNRRLLTTLHTQLKLSRALESEHRLLAENRAISSRSPVEFIACSVAMRAVLELVEQVGPSQANVLITGEHGTGKGVIARELHARSVRSERPLLAVNVGALSEGLFESELFGHVAGAYTDARTARGTLRAGRRGDAVLGRNRQSVAPAASQAPAGD